MAASDTLFTYQRSISLSDDFSGRAVRFKERLFPFLCLSWRVPLVELEEALRPARRVCLSGPDVCKLVEPSLDIPAAKGDLRDLTDGVPEGMIRLLEVMDMKLNLGDLDAMTTRHISDCLKGLLEHLDVLWLSAFWVAQFER